MSDEAEMMRNSMADRATLLCPTAIRGTVVGVDGEAGDKAALEYMEFRATLR